jgi:DNA gyrase subunit A
MEDLIPEEEMVVTITRGGYVKRTRSDNYRSQQRGGKGIKGAQLRGDDVVEHFFVTTTHHWLLFFTNLGRVYRAKAYELVEAGRDAKGQHVANLLAFQPDEHIAQVLDLRDYQHAPYLVLATKRGLVKKTRLEDYDTNRSAGVIAINLRDGDELVSAQLVSETDDLMLVSRMGQSIRFTATDDALRPMGRATSGVTGMKFREDDELLAADVVKDGSFVFIVTEGGYAKRTAVSSSGCDRHRRQSDRSGQRLCAQSQENAMLVITAFSAWRESSRVCCATIGTSERMTLEKSVSRGMGEGSFRLLKRTCLVRRAGTVTL